MNAPAYREFLEAKIKLAAPAGFEVDPADINPVLKPHIQVAVQWMAAGGRRALFSRFGTQKTTAHLELMRLFAAHTGGPTLITLPLGARLSFFNDAREFFTGRYGVRLNFMREDRELDAGAINLTNVESIREGKIDPRRFTATSFDEGDILRNLSTKTFWAFVRNVKQVKYRFVATATPDPNDYTELLAYASYLDIMDIGQARTRFFKRDSEHADKLTIHPHKEEEFWRWVASWALFIQVPSDIDPSFSDDGYLLPALDIRWHEVATDHRRAGAEPNGQYRLINSAAIGVSEAATEKRASIPARIEKLLALRAEQPDAHRLIWHDLEDERRAIEKAVPSAVTVYGAQDLEEREQSLIGFADGRIQELAGKPVMIGSGGNYQAYAWWAIFLGIGFKFKDFIQAIHRLQRYGQRFHKFAGEQPRVRIDLIYTEAERATRRILEAKWRRYEEQSARMAAMLREFGLARLSLGATLKQSIGITRREASGERWHLANNDCVDETRAMESDSVDLIVSSLPFAMQYRYTPSYNDFGHTDDDAHFFQQMDFLTPELLRVLAPGRVAAIHCKDRIVEGARSGLGFQTVSPFGARVLFHFQQHGFAYLGTKLIPTDVVRENAQTNRLGWTEQCKDGSRMGAGLIEYLHLFRKPQTDRGRGYADVPVVKLKKEWDKDEKCWRVTDPRTDEEAAADDSRLAYSRAAWQIDAAGLQRSNGNRLLTPAEFALLPVRGVWRAWREQCLTQPYDYAHHVAVGEALDARGKLKPEFAVIPAHVEHPDVWSIARMRTLNLEQRLQNRAAHLCPLPLDIAERAIRLHSMPGESVFDPFGGLMTVPYVAVKLGRRGVGCELNADYFADGVRNCEAAERGVAVPTLFDLLAADEADDAPAVVDDAEAS